MSYLSRYLRWGGHSISIAGLLSIFNLFVFKLRSLPTLVTTTSGPRAKALALRVTYILICWLASLEPSRPWLWNLKARARARPGRHLLRLCPLHSPSQTGQLSSQGLFLSRAAVNRHISHAKACRNAGMGYREMPIQVLAAWARGSCMAGGGRSGTDACDPSSGAR